MLKNTLILKRSASIYLTEGLTAMYQYIRSMILIGIIDNETAAQIAYMVEHDETPDKD